MVSVISFFSIVKHLTVTTSDHVPLLIQVRDHQKQTMRFKGTFKFENMWMQDEACEKVIEDSWNSRETNNLNELANVVRRRG